MPRRFLVFTLLVPVVLLATCSDDSTAPQETPPATFSHVIGGANSFTRNAYVTTTSSGLRLMTGTFDNTIHISGTPDSVVATATSDMFLAAFREDGSVAWTRDIGAAGGLVYPQVIARDASDHIYIGGQYGPGITIGAWTLGYVGGNDAFLARFNTQGVPEWAIGGGTATVDAVTDLASDSDGHLFVSGNAGNGEMSFAGEDVGEFNSISGFLIMVETNGTGRWSLIMSGTGASYCHGVARLGDGTVAVCGNYNGSDMYIGNEVFPLTSTQSGFIARFTTDDGVLVRKIYTGGTGYVSFLSMAALGSDILVAGYFTSTVDFDVNTGAGSVTSAGQNDAFVARYSADGTLRWVRSFGQIDNEWAYAVCAISSSEFALAGTFKSYITLGSTTLPTNGQADVWIARMSAAGDVLQARRLGGPSEDGTPAIASANGAIIVTGYFFDEIRFPDGTRLAASGAQDAYIFQQP